MMPSSSSEADSLAVVAAVRLSLMHTLTHKEMSKIKTVVREQELRCSRAQKHPR